MTVMMPLKKTHIGIRVFSQNFFGCLCSVKAFTGLYELNNLLYINNIYFCIHEIILVCYKV